MRSKFTWIFSLFALFVMSQAFAQGKIITGTVIAAVDNFPLPGVTVTVKGTTTSVSTDVDGKYSIEAPQGAVLQFSYVSFETTEQKVGADSVINVSLESTTLEEVVVVGYGKTTKEAFTGTATKINAEHLEAKTVSNISQALRGEVAGVNVITNNGAPGSDAVIRIRGFGSVNGNTSPLYVVDGAPFSSDISAINPNDIGSIVVLKDAAATSIYGSRGANGVILITTKQGKAGKSVISVDFKTSINTQLLPTYDAIESPEEYIGIEWSELKMNATLNGLANPAGYASANLYGGGVGIDPAYNIWNVEGSQLIDPTTGQVRAGVTRKFTPTKWSDAAFGTGIRKEANLLFSGGSDKTKYSTSFGYLDDEGFTINSGYTRYTTRINLEHKPKEWLTVAGNIGYTGSKYRNSSSAEGDEASSGNVFALTSTTPAIYDVYLRDTDGNLVEDPRYGGSQFDYGNSPYNRRAWNGTNAIGDATYDLTRNDGTTLLGNFNFDVDFTKWLSFETRYSGQFDNFDYVDRQNPYYGSGQASGGFLTKDISKSTNQNFLQLLRFQNTFGEHSVEAFVAHESTEFRFKEFYASASRAILPNTLDLAQYTTIVGRPNSFTRTWALESYFAQLNYDYADKYFLTASVRRDGTSTFINNKWGTFGSVGLGWIVSKEKFLEKATFIDFLKLKASYGIIGDMGLNNRRGGATTQGGNSVMYGFQVYQIQQTSDGSYSFTRSSEEANPDLTWETSKISQVGLESTWFDNLLDINVDFYVKNTTNLFFDEQLAPHTPYTFRQVNKGKLQNKGLEFDVQANLIKAKKAEDLSLSVGVNGEMFKNKLLSLPLSENEYVQQDGSFGWSEGHSIYDWNLREWAGVDPATGVGLWNMYYIDANDNGIFDGGDTSAGAQYLTTFEKRNPGANIKKTTTDNYSQATQTYSGKSAIPKVRGSFRVNAGFKNFDFTAQFGYSVGGYIYDNGYATLMSTGNLIGTNNFHTDIRNRWMEPGDVTNVPRLSGQFGSDSNFTSASTRWLTKADYLSLNNVRLGYTIPQAYMERLHVSRVNLYVTGDNLMMISAREGLNPQTLIATSNSGIYMPMTTFSVGAKIEF
ncbi:SusC/RagA family TonB-linked outer membrane protein [Flavobacterium sp. RHBU_24]|uniref:SusC/RagA family TonB-linked outer membrane protein n=1 Tax=Flavobacterium sp. RHBU_24 TaxID=3391185 RepID=UPI0039853390